MRSLRENVRAVVDLNVVLMIGIAFAGLMVIGFILWTVVAELDGFLSGWVGEQANSSLVNVTGGFDSSVNLIIVAITIFILALAISALLLLRARRG